MCSDIIFLVIFTKGTVWTMVKMIALKCPECGSKLQIEDGHKECFCQYCGHKILLDDGSVETTYTYRKVDEARLKEAEVDKLIRLKELEIKQKELDRKAKSKTFKAKLGIVFVLFGIILIFVGYFAHDENIVYMGIASCIVAMYIGILSLVGDDDKKEDSK